MSFKQNQPVAPVVHAQAAINEVAAQPTLAGLQQWLLESQGYTQLMMQTTTGDAFAVHALEFEKLWAAYQVVHRFVALSRG